MDPERPDTATDGGRSAAAWQCDLENALNCRDHENLRRILSSLREEIVVEAARSAEADAAPHLDRLVEHARRLLRDEPTAEERLERELERERALWAVFRRRYRDTFVPACLHPYLDSCAAFLAPTAGGVQFAGFDKYAGVRAPGDDDGTGDRALREAITLFVRGDGGDGGDGETPAHFLTTFDPRRGRFTVLRAYRTVLPRGAGAACLDEQLSALAPAAEAIRSFVWDNVQHRATYRAHVVGEGAAARVREGIDADGSPLGRLAARLLARRGLRLGATRALLDGFGFLDLRLDVAEAGAADQGR